VSIVCAISQPIASRAAKIEGILPTRGSNLEDTEVWIRGKSLFRNDKKTLEFRPSVLFGDVEATVKDYTNTWISVIVPKRPDLAVDTEVSITVRSKKTGKTSGTPLEAPVKYKYIVSGQTN
jgi:hypothetical protein